MGLISSRRTTGVEEADVTSGNLYRYPPKSGCYFGNYFIMGGERFDTNQQDTYLFGENEDLNFLGNKPVPFPYPAPQPHEPTKTLKSLVNIRKDSLKFVRESEDSERVKPDGEVMSRYNVEFTFDSDVKCAITIYYFATEEITNKQAVYYPRDPRMNSETFHYKRGANQVFSQSTHVIDPAQFSEEDWQYSVDNEVIPVVIQCVVEEEEFLGHSHATFAVVDKSCDGGYVLKCLKQKQMIDGVCYLLQEIYGIENKNIERTKQEDDIEDNGSECVICMSETRDTLILPCRHLCLCNGCADNLRYQANNCPICRAKFTALLQLRAMRRKITAVGVGGGSLPSSALSSRPLDGADDVAQSQDGVPSGYEAVSLIEALNGPSLPQCALSATIMPSDGTVQSLSSAESPRDDSVDGLDSTQISNDGFQGQARCTEVSAEIPETTGCELESSGNGYVRNSNPVCPDVDHRHAQKSFGSDFVLNVDGDDDREEFCSPALNVSQTSPACTVSFSQEARLSSVAGEHVTIDSSTRISHSDDVVMRRGGDVTADSLSSGLLNVRQLTAPSHNSPESSCTSSSYSSKDLLEGSAETTDSEF